MLNKYLLPMFLYIVFLLHLGYLASQVDFATATWFTSC